MFNETRFWKDRVGARIKDLSRYLRYIFNGHLVVVLLFLIGGGAYYYQNWVKTLPADFPAGLIMAVILGILLTYSPVYNFLLRADQVFLIPLETKLKGYFWRCGGVSLLFQGYILLMVFAAFMPMYAHISTSGYRLFLPYFAILLAVKAWNLGTGWQIRYFVQSSVQFWDYIVRYFVNALFCYLLLKRANVLFLLLMALLMLFYFRSFYIRTRKMGLKWNLLIHDEEKRMSSFYHLANLFTDVPKLEDTVKRRKWLDVFIYKIAFSQDKTYLYLFSRTFLRSSDYLGLFVRLTIIGGAAVYFISYGPGQILLSLVFLYLTGFQLLPLWNHHQHKLWVDLYPVAPKFKRSSFHFLLMEILTVQSFLLALCILIKGDFLFSLLTFAAGTVFSYLFVYHYSNNRWKSQM